MQDYFPFCFLFYFLLLFLFCVDLFFDALLCLLDTDGAYVRDIHGVGGGWYGQILPHLYVEARNSLFVAYSDVTWRHRYWSTLAQVMACCLMARSHYLSQCWLLISEVLWHSLESNFTANAQATILYNELKIILLKLLPHLLGDKELRWIWFCEWLFHGLDSHHSMFP